MVEQRSLTTKSVKKNNGGEGTILMGINVWHGVSTMCIVNLPLQRRVKAGNHIHDVIYSYSH